MFPFFSVDFFTSEILFQRETINPDGSRVVTFANGTRKEISDDGLSVVVTFFNGDIKQIFPDKRVVSYLNFSNVLHPVKE